MKKRAALCPVQGGGAGEHRNQGRGPGSEDHGNRRVKLHGAVCDGAVIGPDMDAVFLRLLQCSGKFRVAFPVGGKSMNALHLDHKKSGRSVSILYGLQQGPPGDGFPAPWGASGNMAVPSISRVTPFTSMNQGEPPQEKARSNRESP